MKKIREMIEDYNTKKIAKKHWRTIEQQKYRKDLAENLNDMRQCWDKWQELAKNFLEKEKHTRQYLESLWSNRKLWMDIAIELIERWDWKLVADFSDKFKWFDYDVIAKEFIKKGDKEWFRYYIEKVEWLKLDYEIIGEFINEEFFDNYYNCECIVSNIDKFEWVDYNKIANLMLNQGWREIDLLFENLSKFNWLSKDVFKKLIKCWIVHDRDNEEAENEKNERKIKVISNLDKFETNYGELAEILNEEDPFSLFYNIDKFWSLDQKFIKELFYALLSKLRNWKRIGSKELADILEKLDMFHEQWGLSYSELLVSIMKRNHNLVHEYEDGRFKDSKEIIADFFSKFKWWLLDMSVAEELIPERVYTKSYCVHYDVYRNYDVYESYWDIVYKNINKFKPWDHKDIAIKLIDAWYIKGLMKYLDKFEWLDEKVANILIEKWYWDFVAKHPKKFWLKKEK